MPLMQGKSKKAFGKNVATEMEAGKPQPQSLAIAYNVQKKNKRPKKMAKGGVVSAADESRPMPGEEHEGKALNQADWTGSPQDREAAHDVSSPMNSKAIDWTAQGEVDAGNSRNAQSNSADITANDESRANAYAKGGEVEDHYDSIADAILAKKRKAKMMADGGEVDLEANSREDLNNEDDMSFDAGLKEHYDDSQISGQPSDSNEHGHDLSDEDAHDMVDSIRKKMKSKGRI